MITLDTVGTNILKFRRKMNMSQEQFGKKIGVSKQRVYFYEQGKVSLKILLKISQTFNLNPASFLRSDLKEIPATEEI